MVPEAYSRGNDPGYFARLQAKATTQGGVPCLLCGPS